MNPNHHMSLPAPERAARLVALAGAPSYELAATVLAASGFPTDSESLRSWAKRNGLNRLGAKVLRTGEQERLEAAEALADRVCDVLDSLPDRLTGPAAAKALGRVHSAVDEYLSTVTELRGMPAHG